MEPPRLNWKCRPIPAEEREEEVEEEEVDGVE